MVDIGAPGVGAGASLLKGAESSLLFFFCVFVWEVLADYLGLEPGFFV